MTMDFLLRYSTAALLGISVHLCCYSVTHVLVHSLEVAVDPSGEQNIEQVVDTEMNNPSDVGDAMRADVDDTGGSKAESTRARRMDVEKVDCGMWLAPSSIQGAGLGMYAGRDFAKGELLEGPQGDIVIPIIDIRAHNSHLGAFMFLWDEYTWNAEALQVDHEGLHDMNIASPGFGSAANSFLPLHNVDEYIPSVIMTGLHRFKDPGAGASTLYHNRSSSALKDIPKGAEFFVSYGEQWFTGRQYMGPIPLTEDHSRATTLARQYGTLKNRSKLSAAVLDDVWKSFVQGTAFNDSRVMGGFNHSDPTEIERMVKGDTDLTTIRIEQSTRTVEWLEENGVCCDHLRPGPSTIPQAGHGAFAERRLPEGTIVAHLPMIHVFDRDIFNMYEMVYNEAEKKPVPDPTRKVWTKQLLLNYCYGHRDSSLLFCPYSPMVNYVNHNQTLANVRLQWPDRVSQNLDFLKLDIDVFNVEKSAKLGFDLIATRTIEEGEEVFLDYGDEWEQAWLDHVAQWKPVDGAQGYKSAKELNEDKTSPIPTEFELLENPMPNVHLWCSNSFLAPTWKTAYVKGILDEYLAASPGKIYACDVLKRRIAPGKGEKFLYTAIMWYEDTTTNYVESIGKLNDVPREAFTYFDHPYTTDMFLPNAYRHDIRIPDNLFPDGWRNRKNVENLETIK